MRVNLNLSVHVWFLTSFINSFLISSSSSQSGCLSQIWKNSSERFLRSCVHMNGISGLKTNGLWRCVFADVRCFDVSCEPHESSLSCFIRWIRCVCVSVWCRRATAATTQSSTSAAALVIFKNASRTLVLTVFVSNTPHVSLLGCDWSETSQASGPGSERTHLPKQIKPELQTRLILQFHQKLHTDRTQLKQSDISNVLSSWCVHSQSVVSSGQMGRGEPGRGGRRTQEEIREEMHLPPLLQWTAVVNMTINHESRKDVCSQRGGSFSICRRSSSCRSMMCFVFASCFWTEAADW